MQVDQTADDDLIVIDEVRHDLVLNSFFKMTADSIQQIRFDGIETATQDNFKELVQQGFVKVRREKVAKLRQNCLSQLVPISDTECLIVGGASNKECISVFNNVTCV